MNIATTSAEIGRGPVFVQIETVDVEPLEIEFISSGTIPECGPPRYRTKTPGKMKVRLWMRRNNGLCVRFEDGAPLFDTAYAMPFEEARKNFYTSGGALPIHYIPPRSSEPRDFTEERVGWRGEEKIETVSLSGQTEARLSRPAAATLFSIAAGGLIASSGKRVLPHLDDDGITLRFAEPVYGTLTVRYMAEYLEFRVTYSLPDTWFTRKSAIDPALTNNERIARRKIAAQEIKPILICVDSPPGEGNMPEDRQWSTMWMQMINREFKIGPDEYETLKSAIDAISDNADGKVMMNTSGFIYSNELENGVRVLRYFGVPVKKLGQMEKIYRRVKLLGKIQDSKSLAHPEGSRAKMLHFTVNDAVNGSVYEYWRCKPDEYPQLNDVAVHAVVDAVLVSKTPLNGFKSEISGSTCETEEHAPGIDYSFLAQSPGPSPTITVQEMHNIVLARAAAYGIAFKKRANEFVHHSSAVYGNFYQASIPGIYAAATRAIPEKAGSAASMAIGQITLAPRWYRSFRLLRYPGGYAEYVLLISVGYDVNNSQGRPMSAVCVFSPQFFPARNYIPGDGEVVVDWHYQEIR